MELVLDFAVLLTHELVNGVLPGVHVSDEVMVLLVCSLGPFTRVVNARFKLDAAERAARRLLVLEAGLRVAPRTRAAGGEEPAFEELRFESVTALQPARPGEKPFAVGPVNLTIPRGSITVVHGENGSGKSTFLDVALGLIRPQTGRLLRDGNPIDSQSIDAYRRLFSLVYAHPHLFDRLYGHRGTREEVQKHLHWLGLGDIDAEAPHRISSGLSTGQRKRLALARALAENRPVLVLDEYTADQDPAARDRFHTEILPKLKAEGRTVIAVLHGSSTPACADRVIRFKHGRMIPDQESVPKAGHHE
jgi:putative ATP-binding cassette transporter